MKIIFVFVFLFISTVGNVLGQKTCQHMMIAFGRLAIAENCQDYNPLRVKEAMVCILKFCISQDKNYNVTNDMKVGLDVGGKLSCDGNHELYNTIITSYNETENLLIKSGCPIKHSRAVGNEINTDSLCIEKFNKFDKKFNLWEKYILESSIRFGIYAKQHMELKKWRKDIMNLYKQGNYKGCEKMATKGLLYIPS